MIYKNKIIIFGIILTLIYFLSLVFSGNLVLPQTFSLGPVTVHYYGIFMALAIASAFYFALSRVEENKIEKKIAEELMFWIIVCGFIGARLYHVMSSWQYYISHPLQIFMVWQGGLSIYGALVGGLIALLVFIKLTSNRYSLTSVLNWLTPSILIGQVIGRFGNMFNYEVLGYPTNIVWKMFVPESFRPENYRNYSYFHPFFLYEALGNFVILLVILKLEKKNQSHQKISTLWLKNSLFILYLLLYNLLRLFLEFLRTDSTFVHTVRLNAAVSLALVIISLTLLIFRWKKNQNTIS